MSNVSELYKISKRYELTHDSTNNYTLLGILDQSMSTNADYQDRLETIVTAIEGAGSEIQDQIEGQTDQGHPISGYLCQHGDNVIQVVTSPGWQWFEIRFEYNADQDQAVHLALTDREPASGDQINVELDDQALQAAADTIDERYEELPNDRRQSFRVDLIEALTRGGTSYQLVTRNDPLQIHQFTVAKKLWATDQPASVAAFGETAQTVVNNGILGQELFVHQYELVETHGARTDTAQPQQPEKGFQ